MLFKSLAVAAAVGSAVAQRPTNTSICDYYTTALLTNNTAANQLTLLTLVVNTAVIGNYTKPNVGVVVPGILNPNATINGTDVNLVPYFSGALASTNTGAGTGRSVNFLDGGGATPLEMNMAANSTTSNQYVLLTHLYEYFGVLLGCSMQGTTAYPAYSGSGSMYKVHEFMDLSYAEVSYFVEQVGLSAASFGVADADVTAVGTALMSTFGYSCAPPAVVVPSQSAALQAICIGTGCPVAAVNATCSSYNATMKPVAANSSNTVSAAPSGSASATTSGPAPTSTVTTAGAAVAGLSFAAVAAGFAALLL